MHTPRHIALLVFPGIQILDVSGPAAVFAAANDAAGRDYYQVHILSAHGGQIASNSALNIDTAAVASLPPGEVDTLLFSGGDDAAVLDAADDPLLRDWVLRASPDCRRLGSICSGALALARLGLLDGKRATTHWSACTDLATHNPQVQVDANAVYVEDGGTWTSAGVTTGIDMSLRMVALDLGESIANQIAKRLVVYARRPGYQRQLSAVLAAQEKADPDFAALVDWIKTNLARPMDVPLLAERVAMSPRTFHRKFTSCFGQTPARFVEGLKLEQGRNLLSSGLPGKFIASQCGYADFSQFSKAFQRRFGYPPTAIRGGE